ncbi:MAG TPA: sialidase family protein [Candidatus Methanoperedens sp.]|nr:sialidase family protein [Candidatus Methanoperedens sp.]
MKNIISRLFLIQIILLSITGIAIAAWNEPYFILRDSDRPSLIQDNSGTYWIAFNSWTNPQNIWIMSSIDGISWEGFYRVTVSNRTDYAPNLIQDRNGRFWIVYASLVEVRSTLSFNYDIKLVYSDNGTNWSNPVSITDTPVVDAYPYLVQDENRRYFITYSSYTNESINDLDIYMKYSDDGFNWSVPIRITDAPESDIFPIMIQDQKGKYWMMFDRDTRKRHEPSLNKYDVFLMRSEDGIHWSDIAEVTNLSYNVNYPFFLQDKNGTFWIPHMTGITGSEELGIMGSKNGTDWTDSILLSNYSEEGYFKTDYKSMIQDRNGTFIYAFTSARTGRGIWLMNGTPDSDFSKTHRIEFNITRISDQNDRNNSIRTIEYEKRKESGVELGLFTFLAIFLIRMLKKPSS